MRFVVAILLVMGACGPSTSDVKQAQGSVYDASFADVWNAVSEEMRSLRDLEVEDAVAGIVRTRWWLVENATGEGTAAGVDPSQTAQRAPGTNYIPGGIYFRLMAKVKGPPWRIDIDGEAAEYRPGYVQLIPFRHGVADEPTWVQGRIDKVIVAIHNRLKQFAVKAPPSLGPGPDKPAPETQWGALPEAAHGAASVIAAVHQGAAAKKAAELRPHLADALTWSAAAPPSAEVALAMWSADPQALVTLARTLEAGCGYSGAADAVVCPAGAPADAGGGPRAVFRRFGAEWKLAVFVTR